jgi:4a-hydroxytetrahydrobiopterin dehydratase
MNGTMQKMSALAERECQPCEGNQAPLKGAVLQEYLEQLGEGWGVVEEHHLEKEYTFGDFRQGLEFTNKVGEIAEAQGHHPDIYLSWGKVKVTIWTHAIKGLSENDFILAAKIEEMSKG